MCQFWPENWPWSLKKFELWSLTCMTDLLKQYLTEKENGYLESGCLREVITYKKWSLREREFTVMLLTTCFSPPPPPPPSPSLFKHLNMSAMSAVLDVQYMHVFMIKLTPWFSWSLLYQLCFKCGIWKVILAGMVQWWQCLPPIIVVWV